MSKLNCMKVRRLIFKGQNFENASKYIKKNTDLSVKFMINTFTTVSFNLCLETFIYLIMGNAVINLIFSNYFIKNSLNILNNV